MVLDPRTGFTSRISSFVRKTMRMGAITRKVPSEPPPSVDPKGKGKKTLQLSAVMQAARGQQPTINEAFETGTLRMPTVAQASEASKPEPDHWDHVLSDPFRVDFLQNALVRFGAADRERVMRALRDQIRGKTYGEGLDGFNRDVYAVLDKFKLSKRSLTLPVPVLDLPELPLSFWGRIGRWIARLFGR